MLDFIVNDALCTRCGECVKDCPSRVIEQQGNDKPFIAPDREGNCVRCQHCMAICPTAAVSISGRDPHLSRSLVQGGLPTLDSMELLMRGRRTVRRFKDENVDPVLVERLLATVANAPSGVNKRPWMFHLVGDKKDMRVLREKTLADLVAADKAGKVPQHFAYLKDAPGAYAQSGRDILFRGAPHALIISAVPGAICPREDVLLAVTYFELLARTAGLGTVWWGMLSMVLAVLPNMKEYLGIPGDHPYCFGILFGIPDVEYKRTVQREDMRFRRIELGSS